MNSTQVHNRDVSYLAREFVPAGANTVYARRNSFAAPATAAANKIIAGRTETALFLAQVYSFTVTSANATAGAIYTDANGNQWTVVATIAGATTLVLTSASGTPPASGTLTKLSGTGDATITFSTPGSNLLTQPDVARVFSITGTGSDHDATGNVVLTILDVRGNIVTDTIALNSNTTVNGVKAGLKIISIDLTGVSALDANAGVEVGTTQILGLDRLCDSDGVVKATVNGAADSALPTVTFDAANISGNTVSPATAPNASRNFIFTFFTNEVRTGK
jgi:hypothetical protein